MYIYALLELLSVSLTLRYFMAHVRGQGPVCPLNWFIIGNAMIIVTIWNVVFANKSRKLGWIWMKLGRWG